MATANDLISRALRKVGILASGETSEGSDADETLEILNDILEQWSLEDLMVYYPTLISHALTAGVSSYTIGATGVIATTRPIEILNPAYLRTADGLDIPIEVVSFETYQAQIQKATTGTYPSVLAYQPAYPDGVIYLWQSPAAGLTLRMVANVQFAALADLSTDIALPIGYAKAIVDALSYELCLKYGRTEMLEDIRQSALVSKMNIKRKNAKKTAMRLDSAFLIRNNSTYNPYSDT